MPYDKVVDSAALDDALDYTASRIRAKSGTSTRITFDLDYGLGFGDAIDAIPELPGYLGHMSLTPGTDLRSVQIPIGDAHMILISSTHDRKARTYTSAIGGIAYVTDSNSIYTAVSRLAVITTGGSVNYYASNSSGGQAWSCEDGVLTISNTSGWVFAAGVTYDFFWY